MKDWTKICAHEFMTQPVTTLSADSSIDEAVHILSGDEISGAPVTDEWDHPIGVISLSDLVAHLAGSERNVDDDVGDYYLRTYPDWDRFSEDWAPNLDVEVEDTLEKTRVADVMSPEIVSVSPDTDMAVVVTEMSQRRIHRLLVVDDESGELKGLITTLDVMEVLAKVAADIEE